MTTTLSAQAFNQTRNEFENAHNWGAAAFTPAPVPAEHFGLPISLEQRDLMADIASMVLLSHDWDGEGALPTQSSAVERAAGFVSELRVPWLPTASPTTDGGVRIEWDGTTAFLLLDFLPDGLEMVYQEGSQDSPTQVLVNDEIPSDLRPFFAKVFAAHIKAT